VSKTGQYTRKHERAPADFGVLLHWNEGGRPRSAAFKVVDLSGGGMAVLGGVRLEPGHPVRIDAARDGVPASAIVRYCMTAGHEHRAGLEFSQAEPKPESQVLDYYELLQLSPKAEMETISRVYRILAARYHPDNPETGDPERFLELTEAYETLSNPERRAEYDARLGGREFEPVPLFQTKAFIEGTEGEMNRRLGILCLLYSQRQRNPDRPSLSLLDLESLMSQPREHLQFTLWYLKQKNFVDKDQGSYYIVTAEGVDFVEQHTPAGTGLHRLLLRGPS
jgi:hypothetical protein